MATRDEQRDSEEVGGSGEDVRERRSQDIPTGRISRFMKLSALSAGASTRYFGQKVKGLFQDPEARAEALLKTHLKTAQKTVEVMGNLKGAVMKVGQMISLHPENGILPPELTAAFNRLQSQAPTLPYARIREQIVRELGAPPEEIFACFDEAPMAAASLGQVHAARLKSGEEVVVKVQYPDIDKTIESDLWQLRALFKASGLVGRAAEAELAFQEVRDRLVEELDYTLEAANLEAFSAYFAGDPRIRIPRHHPALSSQRVLTMERMEGFTFEEVLERHPDQAWRDRLGIRLFELLLTQLMDFRTMHADPQLGNFRFQDDGTVIMLDLGCVKRFPESFIHPYLETVETGAVRDRTGFARSLASLGVLAEGETEALDLVWEFGDIVLEPLRRRPYRFAEDSRIVHQLKAVAPKFLAYPQIQAHPDLLYLHRTYAGLLFMLTKLRAEADWGGIFSRLRVQFRPQAA